MTKYLSDKLTILYTLLIIMVVYIHSYYLEAEQYFAALFLQKLTGHGICRIANCLFFCISGYLFARNINSILDVWKKQKKRLHTLAIPYMLWNVIFVSWYVLLALIPGLERFNNSTDILDNLMDTSVWGIFHLLFVTPAAFQLWFLRDLLVMLLFTPLMCWLAKKSWVVALIISLALTPLYAWQLYYWLGITIGIQQWNIGQYPRPWWVVASGTIVFLCYAVFYALGNDFPHWIETIINLLGLYLMWSWYDIVACGRCLAQQGVWKYICGYSFFIYCFHEPAFNIIKKLALVLFGTAESTIVFFYYLNPWIMVFSAILIARFLQKIAPQLYKILTGGR